MAGAVGFSRGFMTRISFETTQWRIIFKGRRSPLKPIVEPCAHACAECQNPRSGLPAQILMICGISSWTPETLHNVNILRSQTIPFLSNDHGGVLTNVANMTVCTGYRRMCLRRDLTPLVRACFKSSEIFRVPPKLNGLRTAAACQPLSTSFFNAMLISLDEVLTGVAPRAAAGQACLIPERLFRVVYAHT